MQQDLNVNGHLIAYELTYKKVKNVNIRVGECTGLFGGYYE